MQSGVASGHSASFPAPFPRRMATSIGAAHNDGVILLLGGAAAMLAGAFGTSFFVADRRDDSPTLRTLATTAPIIAAVLVTRLLGHPDVAIGIIFGTSVAMMSTVVGSVCSVAPVGPAPGRWRRLWGFTLAASLIAFLTGFGGVLSGLSGVVLAIEGALMLWLWHDTAAESRAAAGTAPLYPPHSPQGRISLPAAWGVAIASLLLVALGAGFATEGGETFSAFRGNVPLGTLAATLFSIALVMPGMQSSRRLATAGLSWVPMTSQTGVVLINLLRFAPAAHAVAASFGTSPDDHFVASPAAGLGGKDARGACLPPDRLAGGCAAAGASFGSVSAGLHGPLEPGPRRGNAAGDRLFHLPDGVYLFRCTDVAAEHEAIARRVDGSARPPVFIPRDPGSLSQIPPAAMMFAHEQRADFGNRFQHPDRTETVRRGDVRRDGRGRPLGGQSSRSRPCGIDRCDAALRASRQDSRFRNRPGRAGELRRRDQAGE